MFAKRIVLFGSMEPTLNNHKTRFVPSEQWPRIKDMVAFAAMQKGEVIAICNGDIMLDPKVMKVEQKIRNGGCRCASSRRWHFDPTKLMSEALESATLTNEDGVDDRGRDVFIAPWHVWAKIAPETPEGFRIGLGGWDGFMTDKFREHWNETFLDFTALRIVHHTHHKGRRRPPELEALIP